MSDTLEVKIGASDAGLEATLKTVQAELSNMEAKVKSGDLSMGELEKTMRRMGQVEGLEKKLKAMGDEASGTSPKVDELGRDIKTMGDKGDEAGKKTELSFGKIAGASAIAGASVKAGMLLIDGAMAAVTKTVQSFSEAIDLGGRLVDLKTRTGIAADQLLVLERAFNNAGVGADSLGPIINKMQKAIVDAGDGSGAAADALRELGFTVSELKSLTPDEQFKALGKAIAGVDDPAKRAALSMEIFGKSGGALNQLFANLDEEISTASSQLGVLPAIMARLAEKFDNVGDNISAIKNKFVEFAAGLLSRVMPAIEAVTTALSRIDAAALGQKLADAFIGAGQSMKGFEAALKAINAGQIGTAFEVVWASVVLQTKQTANEIYKNLTAAFSASANFLKDVFDPSGALFNTIADMFDLLGKRASSNISRELAKVFSGNALTEGFAKQLNIAANESNTAANKIEDSLKGAGSRIADQFKQAGATLPDTFKKHYADAQPLLDVTADLKKVDELSKSIEKSTRETANNNESSASNSAPIALNYYSVAKNAAAANTSIDNAKTSSSKIAEMWAKVAGSAYESEKSTLAQEAAITRQVREMSRDEYNKGLKDALQTLRDMGGEYEAMASKGTNIQTLAKSLGLDTEDKNPKRLLIEIQNEIKKIGETPVEINIKFSNEKFQASTTELYNSANAQFAQPLPLNLNAAQSIAEQRISAENGFAPSIALNLVGEQSIADTKNSLISNISGQPISLSFTGDSSANAVLDSMKSIFASPTPVKLDASASLENVDAQSSQTFADPISLTLSADTASAEQAISDLGSTVTLPTTADTTGAQNDIADLSGTVTVDLDAEQSISNIRESLKEGIELDISAKSGTSSILESIKGFVESIKTAVEKIEPKLPVAALTA